MPILDAVRSFLRGLNSYLAQGATRTAASAPQDAAAFLDELFGRYPFTPHAQEWLRNNVRLQIVDLNDPSGGGNWHPDQQLVRLQGVQHEAAIHELAHAMWSQLRQDRHRRGRFVAAVHQLADDDDPRWERAHTLARHYVHGIPTQPGFEHGMLLPPDQWGIGGGPQGRWNDAEMYAGLASGCMADIRRLPPYVRHFYTDLFQELSPDTPSPALHILT